MSKYRYISDPGHGWLEVGVDELIALGIGDKISSFSYQKGSKAYLEEDCDMSLFINEMRKYGKPVELEDVYEDSTEIRNMDYFNFS